jgi:nucleoside-diphosphate-sugar epimerase
VPIDRSQKRAGDIRLAYFDISRTETEFGWRPEVDLHEGMRATVEFFRQQGSSKEQAQH